MEEFDSKMFDSEEFDSVQDRQRLAMLRDLMGDYALDDDDFGVLDGGDMEILSPAGLPVLANVWLWFKIRQASPEIAFVIRRAGMGEISLLWILAVGS